MDVKAPMTQGGHTHGVFGPPTHISVWGPMEALNEHAGPHHAAGSLMPYLDPPPHITVPLPPDRERVAERSGPLSPIRPGGR